ncbi:hypothetical protein CAPTEDRAFT_149791 [Capitella teleta]|uniref:Importin N-terminal domain-containing protein n=1 Tax=Capitella teleta TaxID=283909 RepID=R7UHK7_CAPTE|nr:hypothetical protein CAPTEDRAFT_149791 [Capitella teleta]|eukprot:ELU06029.1 hypothetical protein CAPTEDRAFT_149791 [Capitella teleta]
MEMDTDGMSVLHTLTLACSQNSHELKPAEQQLKEWESRPGFYSILLSVVSDHSLMVNVRWLAVLYLKNGVDRYWRRHAPNALTEDEKTNMKHRLQGLFTEPVPQIATQISVLIAKIARLDCPHAWSDLLPFLLNAVKADDTLVQDRALLTLHHVIKALASKRLACDRKVFEQLTANLLDFAHEMFNAHMHAFQSCAPHESSLWLDKAILSLKVLRKLVSHGLRDNTSNETSNTFLSSVFSRIDDFINAIFEQKSADLVSKREKLLTLLTKVLLDSQEHRPDAFIPFIEPSLQLCVKYCFHPDTEGLLYERLSVNMLNLMRSILRSPSYRPAKNIEDTKPNPLQAHKVKMAFFTPHVLREIGRYLVLNYFPLTSEDLQCWDDDPEEFSCEESGDSWKFSIRPCTENLFLTVVKEFRETLAPVILDLVKEHQHTVDPSDLHAILTKDAVYSAVGQSSFDLYDDIDFDNWFQSQLVNELQIKENHYRILRRRVIWLVGCWVGVKLSAEMRPLLYQSLLPLMQHGEDLVVRMEAAITLKVDILFGVISTLRHDPNDPINSYYLDLFVPVDDFEFQQQQFLPFLPDHFACLFRLLQDVQECQSKMQILHVMSFLIERMSVHVRPHAHVLVQYLPSLWQESEDHNMLRCAILTTLTNLVQGLGAESAGLQSFLVPLIRVSTDVSQPPHVYLCEDGLTLWQTVLHCAPHLSTDLLAVYSNMPQLIERTSETLRTCIKIIEAYLYLGPEDFLQMHSQSLLSSLLSLMTDIKSEGIVLIYKVVELVIRLLPEAGPRVFHQMYPGVMKSILEKDEYPMVAALQMSLMMRLILHHPQFFQEFCDRYAQEAKTTVDAVLGAFIDACVEKMDNVIQPERKKLIALAFATLLSGNSSAVIERFGSVISVCVEVLHDVSKTSEADGPFVDYLVLGEADAQSLDELDTEHERRKREKARLDPVHRYNLREFLIDRLRQLQENRGEQLAIMMNQLDIDVHSQLKHFLQ